MYTPVLSPTEFQLFLFGQILFNRIMSSLYDQTRKFHFIQYVWHSWRHTKRINTPAITIKYNISRNINYEYSSMKD